MTEELTSIMHTEFAKDEDERIEFASIGVYADVFKHRKTTLKDALIRYTVTENQFWDSISDMNCFSFPHRSLDDLRKDWPHFSKEKYEKYKACKTKEEICCLFESIHI